VDGESDINIGSNAVGGGDAYENDHVVWWMMIMNMDIKMAIKQMREWNM
jgi:hypothetical protein